MKKDLILVGGGGHCKSCIDVIEAGGEFKIRGIVDLKEKIGSKVLNYKVIASDEGLKKLINKNTGFLITIGQIRCAERRIKLYEYLKNLGAVLPVIISPQAHVSRHAFIGQGTIVMHKAMVNADSKIGENCIINSGAIIEHDAVIGNYSHISTACVINGGCNIGYNSFVGSNSTVINNVKVASGAIIGAGSLVNRSIVKNGVYAGIPAKELK